jgi:hypothetical protein
MKSTGPTCWICGCEGASREHLTKVTDLKRLPFQISQSKPAYYHTKSKSNIPIKNWKTAPWLKSRKKSMCPRCNGTRTQPFDRAWESLSKKLSSIFEQRPFPSYIYANSVFEGPFVRGRNCVQLFFLKHLVTRLIDEGKQDDIDIDMAARCILNIRPHPSLYLIFGYRMQGHGTAGLSEIQEAYDNVDCSVARLFYDYRIDKLSIRVIYLRQPKLRPFYNREMWHPAKISSRIYLHEFDY